jgi:hypothetical protein
VQQPGKHYTPGERSVKLPQAAMQLTNEMLSGSYLLHFTKFDQNGTVAIRLPDILLSYVK